jgi:putative membrane-bound dehydrogenase-like protein
MTKYTIAFVAASLAGILFASGTDATCAEWETVAVPSEQSYSGNAWYRTWFKPHATFFIKHERDLFGESVILNIRGLAGAHEVYINGKKIGSGGQFPPDFKDGREGNHRHKIPSGALVPDQWNEVAVKVYNPSGASGFLTEAPFVMNYFWECVLEGNWEFRRGDDASLLGSALKDKPATSAFDEFHESNRVLGEADKLVHGEKLPPEESFAKMKAADDLIVELMLAEPLVAQPTHFSFDSRGRLWVAQYRQYPYPAGLKMISRDHYYRSHYDRTPPAPPNHDRGRDIISIHEDTDGDGKYDKHKVFQDGLNMANAAIRGRGGVWVMHTPYLLFYPDQNFDDVPDGPPVVHLQGFGMEDTHSVANGLVWGMDGWLYGAQGSTTSCHVTRPGIDPPNAPGVYFQGCMVWRYHPETHRFEIFSEGGGNNFGLELDSGGRLFTGNNGGQTRGWHYMQGGLHLMQGTTPNKFGPVRNPFAFGELPHMASEQDIPRFTHFATLVESTAMPQKYHNSFFSVEPLHNFVIASKRDPVGATFKTSDLDKVLTSDDFAFRPVYIGNAPDGSVLVADFYEHYIAHGQHYQSQIDPTTGRIFRLRGKQEPLEQDLNLHDKTTDQLIALLSHPNRWHRHTAVRLLGERKDPSSAAKLRSLVGLKKGSGTVVRSTLRAVPATGPDPFLSGKDLESLNALWALYQGFGLDRETALVALQHEYPMVRYWAVRFICDDIGFAHKRTTIGLADSLGELKDGPTQVPEDLFQAILALTDREDNAEVRSQIAGSARRLPVDQALALVTAVLKHREDIDDLYVPLLCWWVLEINLDSNRDAVMALFEDYGFRGEPMVVKHILARMMRGLALKGKNHDLQQCARLLELAGEQEQVDELLKGFEQAYAGRRMVGLPENLARALVDGGRSSLELRVRLGDAAATSEAIALLKKGDAAANERIAIARTLGEVKAAESLGPLLEVSGTATDAELQRAALTAVSAFADPAIGARLLGEFSKFSDEVRPAFFDLMLSRIEWTRQLAGGISSGAIAPGAIPSDVADQLRRHPDAAIAVLAKHTFGAGDSPNPADSKQQIQQLRDVLAEGTGNPYAGEAIFTKQCAACHKLFHKGGKIGPDLTPYQRGNLETLLTSVITPSAEIREGFEYVTVLTMDGRILSGFVTDQDTQIVTLRGKAGEDIRIQREDVDSIAPVGRSLMPDGLLQGMNDQELRDFFAYLRISQPISQ